MQLFNLVAAFLSLAFWTQAVCAQQLTSVLYPPNGAKLARGSNVTVQVGVSNYIQNYDVVAIVLGMSPCFGTCDPEGLFVGTPLYQGPYTRVPNQLYANYTVTVPQSLPLGPASLNVVNLFLVGAEYEWTVNFVNQTVTIVQP